MPDPQNLNVNDHLALELGRKELANVLLRAQLDAAQARIRELEADDVKAVDLDAEEAAAVT